MKSNCQDIIKNIYNRLPYKGDKLDLFIVRNYVKNNSNMDDFLVETLDKVVDNELMSYLNKLYRFITVNEPFIFSPDIYESVGFINPLDEEGNIIFNKITELTKVDIERINVADEISSVFNINFGENENMIEKGTNKLMRYLETPEATELRLVHLVPYIYYSYYQHKIKRKIIPKEVHSLKEELKMLFDNTRNYSGMLKSMIYIMEHWND